MYCFNNFMQSDFLTAFKNGTVVIGDDLNYSAHRFF